MYHLFLVLPCKKVIKPKTKVTLKINKQLNSLFLLIAYR